MNYEMMNNNAATLCGVVMSKPVYSHQMYGEGFYESTLSVPRLSEQLDVIPFTISERLLDGSGIEEGSLVTFSGQLRSYNKMVEGRSKLMLTVFVKEFIDDDNGTVNPNSVELTGYVCKDPIYRTTPLSREICDLLIAVNRAFNKSDYIPCISWGRNARYCRTLAVGTKLRVAGRIQSRNYVKKLSDELSETRTAYEISVGRIELLPSDFHAANDCAATVNNEDTEE